MNVAQTRPGPQTLLEQWDEYRINRKRAFMYDAAEAMGVSEMELLAAHCGDADADRQALRLEGEPKQLLEELHRCGQVMALTRNHWAVSEIKGHYRPVDIKGAVGLVLDERIDLRLFMSHWKHAFAVYAPSKHGVSRSIQFFDGSGKAVHKVYANKDGAEAFEAIVERFRSSNQSREQSVEPPPEREGEKPDAEIDVHALRKDWSELRDTHEFSAMLKRNGVSRTQAMRLVGEEFAVPLARDCYKELLQRVADDETPIMIFIGNRGCIQIYSGAVKKIVPMDGWFNIMDPGFNMHLREEGVDAAWLVRKPTDDGTVTSVELYDACGKEVAVLFGKRKPGIPELTEWRETAESMAP
jgi:putative hemin transport protein